MFLFLLLAPGKYEEALGKWEVGIIVMTPRPTLHKQNAKILIEIGET